MSSAAQGAAGRAVALVRLPYPAQPPSLAWSPSPVSARRPPIAERIRDRLLEASQQVVAALAPPAPRIEGSAIATEVAQALRADGVYVTTVERLLGEAAPACREAMADAASLADRLKQGHDTQWRPADASTDLAHGELLDRLPALFMLGLNATMLSIAEQYLRLPVAYHGAVLRHSYVDGRAGGPRRWHRDAEDFHVLRTVLYLNDVDEDGGPFEYVPRAFQAGAMHAVGYQGMCSDDEMAVHVPRQRWQRCTGPAGTLVIADSARVFHHESPHRKADRTVLTMGHSSRRPRRPALAMAHFPAHQHATALSRLVATEHHPHVFGWRRLAVPPLEPTTSILMARDLLSR